MASGRARSALNVWWQLWPNSLATTGATKMSAEVKNELLVSSQLLFRTSSPWNGEVVQLSDCYIIFKLTVVHLVS
jgi:hypothetical protein